MTLSNVEHIARFLVTLSMVASLLLLAGCASTARLANAPLPTATSGGIALRTDYAVYNASQAIGVTVSNTGETPYFAADSHSVCTIITLQQALHGQWVPIMPCESSQNTHILLIAAHSTVPYTLAPGNAPGNPNAWTPGTYRIALSFGARADGSDATRYAVYSSGFTVIV